MGRDRPDAAASPRVRAALSLPGHPLDAMTLAVVEERMDATFGEVRIHAGPRADAAARGLRASAFTLGNHIAFQSGAYAPGTAEGLRLLSHELAHVLQQRAGHERLQRNGDPEEEEQPPTGVTFWFSVRVDRELPPDELLVEIVQQYLRVERERAEELIGTGAWRWTGAYTASPPSATTHDVQQGYKLIRVTDRGLRPATAQESAQLRRQYGGLGPSQRQAITAETNRRFWERTQYRPGRRLGDSPDDRRMRQYWVQLRNALVRQHVAIHNLPPEIRDMIFGETGVPLRPRDYEAVLRIADKLTSMSEQERQAYLARTTARTSDLGTFEAAIDRYMTELRERREATLEREQAKTRLFGLEEVYRQYRQYLSLLRSTSYTVALGQSSPQAAGAALGSQPTLNRLREELTANLRRHGFASIDAFEGAIRAFETAFRDETVFIAREMLDRYEHVLWTQQERYAEAGTDAELHAALAPARRHFEQAHRIRSEHAQTIVTTPGEMSEQAYWSGRFQEKMTQGRQAVAALSDQHPLVTDPRLDVEALALASESEVAPIVLRQIRDRRTDIGNTRRNIDEKPNVVWELDMLLEQAMREQDIRQGSIYDLIIQDHLRDTAIERAVIALAVAIFALAAGLLSAGTGTVAVLGATAALGVGAYTAWEEFRQFEVRSAAHGARLLSDDPSFAWVVVAVVASGLDLAVAAAALRSMSASVRAFNASDDIVELERSLVRLSDIDDALRQNVLRAARVELETRQAWQAARAQYYGRALAVIDPIVTPLINLAVHFTYPVYLSLRRGIISIERFLLTREAAALIGDFRRLSPQQMARVRAAYQMAFNNAQRVAAHGHSVGMLDSEIEQFLRLWNRHPDVSAQDMMRQMDQWAEPLSAHARARSRVAPDVILDPASRARLPDFEHRIAGTGGIDRILVRGAPNEGRLAVTIEGEILPQRLARRPQDVTPTRRRAPDFNVSRQLFSAEEAFPNLTAAQRARWQRLHLWGPGFGDEAAAGMMWGPRSVNLRWQNDSIESYIRDLAELSRRHGGRTRVRATAVSWENPTPSGWSAPHGDHFLKRAEYEITLIRPNDPDQTIRITLDVAEPPGGRARPFIDPPGAVNLGDLF